MLRRIKAMWARIWRRGGRRSGEREFYDQHEAGRYRSDAEARGSWNPPGGTRPSAQCPMSRAPASTSPLS